MLKTSYGKQMPNFKDLPKNEVNYRIHRAMFGLVEGDLYEVGKSAGNDSPKEGDVVMLIGLDPTDNMVDVMHGTLGKCYVNPAFLYPAPI